MAGEPCLRLLSVVPSLALARDVLARHAPTVLAIRLGAADMYIRALSRSLIRETPGLRGLVYSLNDSTALLRAAIRLSRPAPLA